jgi:hypothetical protein
MIPMGWLEERPETSINDVRKWIKKWLDEPPEIHYMIRKEADKLRESGDGNKKESDKVLLIIVI